MAVSAESLLPCNVSTHDLLPKGGLLTFIVPASGRSTLHRTLISLQQQEDPGWRALVLLDGAHVGLEQRAYRLVSLEKARMRVCCLLKRFGSRVLTRGAEVSHGSAGLVRNVAFAHVRTPWVGFVDDDDTVGPRYVAEVAADGDTFDAIFFRMRWTPWQSELRPDCFGYQCTRRTNTTMSEVLPEWNASFVEKGGETYSEIADCGATGSRLPRGTSVGDLPASCVGAPPLVSEKAVSAPTPPAVSTHHEHRVDK